MVDIQPNILENLKCNRCHQYLSCKPVYLRINGENICGRCPPEPTETRNTAYEEVTSMLLFPCRYNKEGCPTKLTTEGVKQHEDSCEYQKMLCPSVPLGNCTWTGFIQNIHQHFKEKHSELIVDNPFEVKHSLDRIIVDKNYLTTIFGFLFLIQKKYNPNENTIHHSVCLISTSTIASQFNYSLTISKGNLTLISKNIVENISEINDITKGETFNINDLGAVFKGIGDLSFSVSIIRHEIRCLSCSEIIKETTKNTTKECAVFCDCCNPKTAITEKLLKPCIWDIKGCSYKGTDNNMGKHSQWFCRYGRHECQFCNKKLISESKVEHLMAGCNKISLKYSQSATNDIIIDGLPVVMRAYVFGKDFYCILVNKKANLAISIVVDCLKEEIENFIVKVTAEPTGLKKSKDAVNKTLLISNGSNCDWKDNFGIGNVAATVKFTIKKN